MTPTERVEETIKLLAELYHNPAKFPLELKLRELVSLTRREALLEAAKVCKDNSKIHLSEGQSTWGMLAESYAEMITALADKESERG